MYSELKELLFHPDVFFADKTGEKTDLLSPAIIVLLGSMIGLIATFIVSDFLNITESRNILVIMTPGSFFTIVMRPFIAWFMLSVILYVGCRFWAGKGTFIVTLQNTGYGALPLTVLAAVAIINDIFLGAKGVFPQSLDVVVILIFDLITILFVLWSGYIWTYAMEKTHAITRNHAAATTAVAVILYLGFHVISSLGITNTLLQAL